MEPIKLKDVPGQSHEFVLQNRVGRIKAAYDAHGPHQSYLTTSCKVVKENLACFGELIVLDIKSRTKAALQWMSGEAVQPVTIAPLLPPLREWLIFRRLLNWGLATRGNRVQDERDRHMDARCATLGSQLEQAKAATAELARLVAEGRVLRAANGIKDPTMQAEEDSAHSFTGYTGDVASQLCQDSALRSLLKNPGDLAQ